LRWPQTTYCSISCKLSLRGDGFSARINISKIKVSATPSTAPAGPATARTRGAKITTRDNTAATSPSGTSSSAAAAVCPRYRPPSRGWPFWKQSIAEAMLVPIPAAARAAPPATILPGPVERTRVTILPSPFFSSAVKTATLRSDLPSGESCVTCTLPLAPRAASSAALLSFSI
jgi:hypothetical protein